MIKYCHIIYPQLENLSKVLISDAFLQISLFNPIFPMSSLSLLITKLPTGHRLSVLEVLFSEPHEPKELGLRSNIYLIDGQINLRS